MPINDKDFEIIEDTVNDFEYFYDEEEAFKRNRKIVRKYKICSVVILMVVIIFMITILGLVRMKMYGTDNILTKNEMISIDFKNETEEIKEYTYDFYNITFDNIVSGVGNAHSYDLLNERLNVEGVYETLATYKEKLSYISVPKDEENKEYSSYHDGLLSLITTEMNFIDLLNESEEKYREIYEASSNGDSSWSESYRRPIQGCVVYLASIYPY